MQMQRLGSYNVEQFYAGSCITFFTANNILSNLCHHEFSKCRLLSLLVRMQAWSLVMQRHHQ